MPRRRSPPPAEQLELTAPQLELPLTVRGTSELWSAVDSFPARATAFERARKKRVTRKMKQPSLLELGGRSDE